MTTRLRRSSASTRAISRMTVVLPTPGRPRNSTEFGTASSQTYGDSNVKVCASRGIRLPLNRACMVQ